MLTRLAAGAIAISLLSPVQSQVHAQQLASKATCTKAEIMAGICVGAESNGSEVILTGDAEYGGAGGSSAAGGGGSGSTHTPGIVYAPDTGRACDTPSELCLGKPAPAEPTDAGFPAVTLADLVSFRPATPQLAGEPAGFGVVRMPTNFVAAASAQDIAGVLLGYPVTVRFTPVAYVFSYGDGHTTRSATGGASWAASGSPQFTPTDTGHVYDARGTYASSVTVEYSAAVDFGAGWRPVDGVVTARTGDYPVQVVEARTALVEHTCSEDPHGPGC